MYNREIAAQKAAFAFRNQLLTFGVLLVVVIVVWFLVITATLTDPSQLWQRNRGEEYMRPYYQRRDVHAFLWAVGGTLVYYTAAILVFFLICNLLGHRTGTVGRGASHTQPTKLSSAPHPPQVLGRRCRARRRRRSRSLWCASSRRVGSRPAPHLYPHPPILSCASSPVSSRASSAARTCTTTGGRRRRGRPRAPRRSPSASPQSSLKLMQYFSTRRASPTWGPSAHPHLLRRARVGHPRDHRDAPLLLLFLVPFIFRIVYIDEYKSDAPSNSRE